MSKCSTEWHNHKLVLKYSVYPTPGKLRASAVFPLRMSFSCGGGEPDSFATATLSRPTLTTDLWGICGIIFLAHNDLVT
jgi:hypothetical protein